MYPAQPLQNEFDTLRCVSDQSQQHVCQRATCTNTVEPHQKVQPKQTHSQRIQPLSSSRSVPIAGDIPNTRAPLHAPLLPDMARSRSAPVDAESSLVCDGVYDYCYQLLRFPASSPCSFNIIPRHHPLHSLPRAVALPCFQTQKATCHASCHPCDPKTRSVASASMRAPSTCCGPEGGGHWIVARAFTRRSVKN